jgi:hypothetical protein
VHHVESLFMPWDVDALVDGFTGYGLRKQFRTLMGDAISNIGQGGWEDADTGLGQRMKGFGVEIWLIRDGTIAIWEAAFNSAPADQTVALGKMLG